MPGMEPLGQVFERGSETQRPTLYRASWNGAILAEGSETVVVDGNHYFGLADVRMEHLTPSASHTTCHWKGVASYYDAVVDGKVNRDAAWYYADASTQAAHIRGRVAFWHGVKVEPVEATRG
jgi:uncharacterized protein (DUF427 family)